MGVAAGAGGFDAEGHLHLPGPFEPEGQRHRGPLAQRLIQPDQHDMQPAGAEMHGLAGRDRDIRDRAHAHDIAFPDMGMEFHDPGGGAGGGDQPIWRGAGIAQRQEARAIGIDPGGAGPGAPDQDIAGGEILLREGGAGGQAKNKRAKGAAVKGGHDVFLAGRMTGQLFWLPACGQLQAKAGGPVGS